MTLSERKRWITIHEELLRELGAIDILFYSKKLKANIHDNCQFADLLCESCTAMMYLSHGFQVIMRDSPDLAVKLDDKEFFSEVRHFRRKLQDDSDAEKMLQAAEEGRLIEYGRTAKSENEIIEIVRDKRNQFFDSIPNILVIVSSSSQCIESFDVCCAVNRIENYIAKNEYPELQKLSGILFLGEGADFFRIRNAKVPLHEEIAIRLQQMNNFRLLQLECLMRLKNN